MASPISPPRRERARISSISSPCAIVQHPVTALSVRRLLRAKPLRSYMAQAYSVPLKLSSDLPSRFSKPNAATCFHIVVWSRLVKEFRSEVARVLRTLLPFQENLFLGDVFLEPQRSCLQVSDVAHASLSLQFHLLRKCHLPCEQPDLGTSSSGQ